jgi:uncharacterized damage-inducible protein DinB
MADFERDMASCRADMSSKREELLKLMETLDESDLTRSRPGSWTVSRVLQHVLDSERLYVRAVVALANGAQPVFAETPATLDGFNSGLKESRGALIAALEGVDSNSFYTLRQLGHEEYSVLSVLENVVGHDEEHRNQVVRVLEESR